MKKKDMNKDEMHANFPLCLHDNCPKANSCLRQLAFQRHAELGTYLKVVNPSQCTKDEDCPHYRSHKPEKFAKGFTNFQKKMYPEQYGKFMNLLILHFGRNQYFKRRRGEVMIPANEQEVIRMALRKCGADDSMEFDQYIEIINWQR